jgi:lantibiotic modifying enzyme
VFLVRLAQYAGDERYLDGAERHAAFIARNAVRDDLGTTWRARDAAAIPPSGMRFAGGGNPPNRYWSFGIGAAGIGYFLALLQEATRRSGWGALAREVADTLLRRAASDRGGLNWYPEPIDSDQPAPFRCQWCRGAAGIGLCFAKCYETLGGQSTYLQTARAAAEATYAYGDVRQNPSLCHGLCGNALLFLELHRLTGEVLWRERAEEFASRALAYRSATSEGSTWQADEPGSTTPEFMCGAAGVGHFFLQLLDPDHVRMPIH